MGADKWKDIRKDKMEEKVWNIKYLYRYNKNEHTEWTFKSYLNKKMREVALTVIQAIYEMT